MSMSDPLGDMLTRIRNAQRARHTSCVAPASKLRANVLDVLKREGYIRGFAAEELRPGVAQLRIELKYNEGEPVIKEITRVSKPGRRVYSQDQGTAAGLCRPGRLDPVHAARRDERCRGSRRQCRRRSPVSACSDRRVRMSRVGKYPVEIPAGVQVAIAGSLLTAKGKLGEL